MKDEAFGFSGEGHDLGVACSSVWPFRLPAETGTQVPPSSFPRRWESRINEHKDGYPPTTAGMTGAGWIPAKTRVDDR